MSDGSRRSEATPLASLSVRGGGIRGRLARARIPLPVMIYLLSVLLVYAALIPTMGDIGGWDEAAHVNMGRLLVEDHVLPDLAGSPLSALLYGLAYLVFRNSTYWLMYCVWLGRLVSYSLLWWGTYMVARRLSGYASPFIAMGLFVLAPFTLEILIFPSDPLFAGIAAFSLSHVLGTMESRDARGLAWASILMGLAVLARPDGLVLSAVFVIVVAAIGWRLRALSKGLAAGLVPLLVLVGGYALATGDNGHGWAARSYANFETGHGVVYEGSGLMDREVEVHIEAPRVYGTAEDNNYSILRAIGRAPGVYVQRVVAVVRTFPKVLLGAYGKRIGVVLFLLAARGMLELLRRRKHLLLAVLLLWAAPVATGFVITLFRTGHLLFPFYILIALASIGIAAIQLDVRHAPAMLAWTAILAGLGVYGIVDGKLGITYGVGIFLIALLVVRGLSARAEASREPAAIALLVLFCAGLVIRGSFPSPVLRSPGAEPLEESLAYLVEHYDRGESLAAGWPGIAWAARMTFIGLVDEDVPLRRSPDEFLEWMASQGVRAVYVDRSLFADNPAVWSLISAEIDDGLESVFVTDGGDIRIFEIRDTP
jgi:hypothetical protein